MTTASTDRGLIQFHGTSESDDPYLLAVVRQKYEVQVYDEYVISGNTAVLRCQVPSYVAEYVMVTSWIQDGSVNIYPNTDTGQYTRNVSRTKFHDITTVQQITPGLRTAESGDDRYVLVMIAVHELVMRK
jgi:hypothetical protein